MVQEVLAAEDNKQERRFGAWWSAGLVAILLVGSVVGDVLGGIFYAVYVGVTQGQAALKSLSGGDISAGGTAVVVLTGALFGAALFIGISLWRARHLLKDGSSRGIGWVPASNRNALMGAFTGLLMSGLAVLVLTLIQVDPDSLDGPLMAMSRGGFLVQIALVLFAVVYAPIVEEYIFRGVLFAGFRRSWGVWPAAIVVTLLFTGLHAADKLDYLPGFAMVFLMGAVALYLRIRYKSLLPAIAMHFVYNLSLLLAEAAGFIPTV